jgi:CBS domain-containing protein
VQERAVRELMTRDVVSVPPDASFKAVVRALAEPGVHAVPVIDAGGELVGVVSASDLTCHEEEQASWSRMLLGGKQVRNHSRKARGRTARDLMTAPAHTVAPDATVCSALRAMSDAHVGRLVVVEDGRVCGMLTRSDVLRVFLRDDEEIRREVEQVVAQAVNCPAQVEVDVRDGIVLLSGRVERASCAWAAAAGAMSVSGVIDVDDELMSEVDDTEVNELAVHGPFV